MKLLVCECNSVLLVKEVIAVFHHFNTRVDLFTYQESGWRNVSFRIQYFLSVFLFAVNLTVVNAGMNKFLTFHFSKYPEECCSTFVQNLNANSTMFSLSFFSGQNTPFSLGFHHQNSNVVWCDVQFILFSFSQDKNLSVHISTLPESKNVRERQFRPTQL